VRGNLLLGTTTESGLYKLDVNGTTRLQGAITIPTSISAGQILFSGVGSILSGNGNFSWYGYSSSSAIGLYVTPTLTAQSNLARGTLIYPTLVAAANSDVLVGLDVNPTFTNGAFTGVSNYAARIAGTAQINKTLSVVGDGSLLINTTLNNSTSGTLYGILNTTTVATINSGSGFIGTQSTINSSATTGSLLGFQSTPNLTAGTVTQVKGYSTNGSVTGGTASNYIGYDYVDGYKAGSGAITYNRAFRSQLVASGTNNIGLLLNDATPTTVSGNWGIYDQSGYASYFKGAVLINQTTDNGTDKLQVTGSSYFSTNVGIGTASTGGYKLDVNGTARVQGNMTIFGASSQVIFSGTSGAINQVLLVDGGSTSTRAGFASANSNVNIFAYSGNGINFGMGLDASTITNANAYLRLHSSGAILRSDITITGAATINGQVNVSSLLTYSAAGYTGDRIIFAGNNTLGYGINIGGTPTRLNYFGYGAGGNYIDFSWSTTNASTERAITLARDGNAGGYISMLQQTTFGSTTARANASALVQIDATTQGFLPPRMTTTQKNAIASPATGLMVYDTTLNKLCVYTGSAWETVTSL
jgi:hypothetical protein